MSLYLCEIDLMKIDKSKITEFTRKNGDKGKSIKVAIWTDDENPEEWRQCSIQQSTEQDEEKIYLGNGKLHKKKEAETTVNKETGEVDDLPF